ncbi:hypothetical protein Tco_0141033 [Tanacetum coccineum]
MDSISSNFLRLYPWLSSDYIPASPEKKLHLESLNNSCCLDSQKLHQLIHFPYDPLYKSMHAYNAIIPPQVPIPPPTIVPPSLMLSPMFNPQDLFRSEEILPPKKRGRTRSFSFTSALPQAFEMGESSHKTSLECHEEQIEKILNHLNKLSLDRIEHMEGQK